MGSQNIGKNANVFYGWYQDKFGMTYWHKNALLKQFVEKFFAEGVYTVLKQI